MTKATTEDLTCLKYLVVQDLVLLSSCSQEPAASAVPHSGILFLIQVNFVFSLNTIFKYIYIYMYSSFFIIIFYLDSVILKWKSLAAFVPS